MREQFKPRHPKIKLNKWWVMGAIATPILLGSVGLLPAWGLKLDDEHLSPNESVALAHLQRDTLIGSIGAIAVMVGGAFLLLDRRSGNCHTEIANLNGADLRQADLSGVDFSGADLNGADLRGANLSRANLNGANLISANLNGASLNCAKLRYANLSGANLGYANLSGADLRYANLSGANLNCTLLTDANLSDANLSGALLFFINSREVKNLEPLQLKAQPSPFLCHVALPAYFHQPDVTPNRDCDRLPQLLSARYHISLEEAQEIAYEARQHHWD